MGEAKGRRLRVRGEFDMTFGGDPDHDPFVVVNSLGIFANDSAALVVAEFWHDAEGKMLDKYHGRASTGRVRRGDIIVIEATLSDVHVEGRAIDMHDAIVIP